MSSVKLRTDLLGGKGTSEKDALSLPNVSHCLSPPTAFVDCLLEDKKGVIWPLLRKRGVA